ncbi:MAG: hypothetical protein HPY44_13090 [Armatimonadetes bacterium]|nr:hypothetical protein [Armatimonadota bacterium]
MLQDAHSHGAIALACAIALLGGLACRSTADEARTGAYAQWENGPPADPSYFPIAVWLQGPQNAARYKAAGINLYVALWKGPTEKQLADLEAAGMQVICEQNEVGMAHLDSPTIVGWMHGDEPDNAQPVIDPATGKRTWGPCVPPERIVEDYRRIAAADPTRPVLLNLGQGVANDQWHGRGSGAKLSDYETYVKGGDIISFDIYPVASGGENGADRLWLVPKGVDRLVTWTGGQKIIWNCIECTNISGQGKASPDQVKAEVWMALIHGSTGLIYFVHQFQPTFCEWALLEDPEMLAAVTAINQQIRELAPVLNSPTVTDVVSVESATPDVPVDAMVKQHEGATYVFAVGMRNAATTARFRVGDTGKVAQVIGESRTIEVVDGAFEDSFAPYAVHLYRLTAD